MNWVDFIILLIAAFFAAEGFRQGFLSQALGIVGFLISLISALFLYQQVANLLINFFNLPQVTANPVSFLLVWIVAQTIFFAIFSNFFNQVQSTFLNSKIDRYFGPLPAIVNALLFIAFILLFVISLPIKPDIKKDILDSKIGAGLVRAITVVEKPFNDVFGPITKQGLTFLTVKPEEKGSIDLKFTQDKITIDYKAEQEMFKLVNEQRLKNGTKALVWDEKLTQVGRNHSEDMFKRGYFSHYSPEGKDVGDRLEAAGINYSFAGENLALAPSTTRAHDGLMNSPGHRRNILDPAFNKVGIGVIDGGVYGKMFTQVFTE